MKKVLALLLTALLVFGLVGCGNDTVDNTTSADTTSKEAAPLANANVYTLKGPTGMGLAPLMDKSENGTASGTYSFNIASTPDEIVAAISSGSADIASCPLNLASTLYKKTGGAVKLVSVNTLGVMYILSSDENIKEFADLEDKKIAATGQAATPEYIINYLLSKNDMQCEVEYTADPAELVTLAVSGDAQIVMLPEPNVSTAMAKNDKLHIVADLSKEWEKVSDTKLAQSGIIVRADYLENNKEAVENFLKEYKESVDFVNTNTAEAAALIEKFEIVPNAKIAEKAIPNCNIVFIDGQEMKDIAAANLQVLFDANKAAVGGEMPSDEFYSIK